MLKTLCSHSLKHGASWKISGSAKKLAPDQVKETDKVSIHFQNPGADDALLVAGMAIAKNAKTELVVPDRSHLPWFLQNAELSYPNRVYVVETAPKEAADKSPTDPSAYKPHVHDTFIGCLMSGLSKEEYAEGRSHLLAINDALKTKTDSKDNYCEGINIGTNESFGTPKEALVVDMEAIKGSEHCVFYQYDDASRPSGMWVELGAALALDKPCTLLAPNLDGVPPAVRNGQLDLNIIEYGNHDNLKELLRNSPEHLLN